MVAQLALMVDATGKGGATALGPPQSHTEWGGAGGARMTGRHHIYVCMYIYIYMCVYVNLYILFFLYIHEQRLRSPLYAGKFEAIPRLLPADAIQTAALAAHDVSVASVASWSCGIARCC